METQDIVISDADDATFTYTGPFCIDGVTDPTPIVIALPGGTFTNTTGVVFADATTGEIDLSASTAGTHTITYTTAGACPSVETQDIVISDGDDATFTYTGPFCINCLLYTSPSPRDGLLSRMPSSA